MKRGRFSPTCARWPRRPRPIRRAATRQNGEKIFRAMCAGCHRVNGAGGRLGPDLSRVGVARSREMIVLRIRGGVEGFRPGYEPVTMTPQTGPPISRREEERRSLLGPDHGHARADPGIREGQDESGGERHQVGDAGLRLRPAERQRSRRSPSLPANAARIRSGRSANRRLMRHTTLPSRPDRAAASRAGTAALPRSSRLRRALVTVAGDSRRPAAGRLALADLRRQLHQPAAQPAHADHARQRQPAGAAVDVPDRHARQFRNHLAPARQRPVCDRTAERRVGDRRADGPPDLALPPRAAGRA